ncbi:MAG: hypothetical protein IH964_03025 [Candidatus Dadabacteria bacterium]|nr:hypothetical protein [Candidatus Dadabacteria bacterium]
MRNIESRIKKLEQREGSHREEIYELLNEEDFNVFERTRILYDAGLITGEMIAVWIKQGSIKNMEDKNE